ncbi:ubiquitin-like-conjugating enzyme ATG10 isoform X1 [Capsicum annuum]|uniref:ubiquitin-like-conjugating enzyme ATG10 isoform X1 n=1 Tax=Capsicum annuum TaxID=4072 RepID=UPI001FB105E4|nr:ubiquitin-like-conjugating enzyme ATG10 isoform X1 [Capsicum annuum]
MKKSGYGLQLRVPPSQQKKQPVRPPLPKALGFGDGDDDDVEKEISRHASKNKALRDIEEQHKKALEEDPSVFDYDGVYDDMKVKAVQPRAQDREERKQSPLDQSRHLEMSSISSWDGTITSTEFHNAASTFVELWNKFDLGFPPWSWINYPKRPGFAASKVEGYLSLENMILPRSSEEDQHQCGLVGIEDLTCSSEDIFNDSAILVQKDGKERHHYDFHVIYSSSFKVPVLYFRAYCSDGEPLTIEDLEQDFPVYTAQSLAISKWTFITQEEHPYLNRPWYKLHPCGTSEWMKLLFSNEPSVVSEGGVVVEKYLTSWFSAVLPIFGLKIPLKLSLHV